jgi:hypothetical protein
MVGKEVDPKVLDGVFRVSASNKETVASLPAVTST